MVVCIEILIKTENLTKKKILFQRTKQTVFIKYRLLTGTTQIVEHISIHFIIYIVIVVAVPLFLSVSLSTSLFFSLSLPSQPVEANGHQPVFPVQLEVSSR